MSVEHVYKLSHSMCLCGICYKCCIFGHSTSRRQLIKKSSESIHLFWLVKFSIIIHIRNLKKMDQDICNQIERDGKLFCVEVDLDFRMSHLLFFQ